MGETRVGGETEVLGTVEGAGAWAALESHPAAQRCLTEAPAPDVEVTVHHALLRGGQPFKAWGTITATTFVEQGRTGDAYRLGAATAD